MLKLVCDKCGKVIDDTKSFRRIDVSVLTKAPTGDEYFTDLLDITDSFDLCKKCYEKLDLKQEIEK